MSNKGKHIYYCKAKFLIGFDFQTKYLNIMASSDKEAINKAKEEFDKLSAIFSGVSYKNLVVENNKHIQINK